MRCWVRWPRTPTRGLSENGARRSTAPCSASAVSSGIESAVGARLVLRRVDDRRRLLPVRDAVFLERDRVAVVVHLGPVRMVELVQGEAGVERVVEAHVVHALVDRLLDEQR